MARLGGQTVDLNPQFTQLGQGEPLEDTARVLNRFCDVLAGSYLRPAGVGGLRAPGHDSGDQCPD